MPPFFHFRETLMILSFVAAAILAATAPAPMPDDEVLATVNGVAITRHDLQQALDDRAKQEYREALDDLKDVEHSAVRDFAGRREIEREAKEQHTTTDAIYERLLATEYEHFDANLRNRIEQQRARIYNAERASLDELVQKKMFEQAANAKGMTAEELTRSLESQAAVTKADLDFIKAYEYEKQAPDVQSAPPGDRRLEAAIRAARAEQARRAVLDSVRAKSPVELRLTAPRVALSTADAPTYGNPAAPVKLVVFTDFECPYCKSSEGTLAKIRQQYGDRLAIYFRNYPLPNHLYAKPSAIAAVCAAEQGKYAAYHDLLFAHQDELAHADYALWSEMAGLDRAKFEACRASDEPWHRVEKDIAAGVAAGVAGTPSFFVNGRAVPNDLLLRDVIEEELAAAH
jgi:protein-disulfide isomerase